MLLSTNCSKMFNRTAIPTSTVSKMLKAPLWCMSKLPLSRPKRRHVGGCLHRSWPSMGSPQSLTRQSWYSSKLNSNKINDGQILRFHQSGFPWNKGSHFPSKKHLFEGNQSCQVTIIWPKSHKNSRPPRWWSYFRTRDAPWNHNTNGQTIFFLESTSVHANSLGVWLVGLLEN